MTDALFSLQGRTAVVTGGGGVLGGAMCRCLANAGAKVAVLGRTESKLVAVVDAIREAGGEALAVAADVLSLDALKAAAQRVESELGPVDILVNAAGGNQPGATIGPDASFFDLDPEAFNAVVGLNLNGTLLPTLAFGQHMADRKRGTIINISSMAASRPLTRVIGYSAAKASIDNFTRWLAVEAAQKLDPAIRVNAIAPGFFLTEQNRALLTESDGSLTARGQTIVSHTPAGRFGDAEDIDSTLLWLCGDGARFVTGIVVPVDGGFSAFSGV